MQEYAVYNNEIAELLDLPFEVDSKGTVIFTLPNGGKIRDDGQEIHFSAHDPEAAKKQILVEYLASREQQQKSLHGFAKPAESQTPEKPGSQKTNVILR